MKPYAIISLLGKHNIIGASRQELRMAYLTADDISRIIVKYYNNSNVITTNSIGSIYQSIRNKNNVILYLGNENAWNELTPLFPSFSFQNALYKNMYFYVQKPVGFSKVSQRVLEEHEFPQIPTYPIAGTDMQKVNLLDKYMN